MIAQSLCLLLCNLNEASLCLAHLLHLPADPIASSLLQAVLSFTNPLSENTLLIFHLSPLVTLSQHHLLLQLPTSVEKQRLLRAFCVGLLTPVVSNMPNPGVSLSTPAHSLGSVWPLRAPSLNFIFCWPPCSTVPSLPPHSWVFIHLWRCFLSIF